MKKMFFLCTILSFLITFGDSTERLSNDTFDASSVDTETVNDCPFWLIPCFGACCPPGITYCNSQRRDCEPYPSNRLHKLILVGSSGKGPTYSADESPLQKIPIMNSGRIATSNDITDRSGLEKETVTDCPFWLIPCFGACCPPGITYCNSQRRDCEPYPSNRFLNLIFDGSSGKSPSYSAVESHMQKSPSINSERTVVSKDISDTSSLQKETVTDCPFWLIPCFGACCPPGITYCNSQRRDCEPYPSNPLLNLILVESSRKGPSYSAAETKLEKIQTLNSEKTVEPNDASDTACLDTETQCAGGCCPYLNASCCSETCCGQGAVCLGPLNTCIGIKQDEKNNVNPVLYTEKAVKLRQVNDCPPFMIACFGVCCPSIGMYCDSQRQTCAPLSK